MVTDFLHRVFGTKNDRTIKRLKKNVQLINALEPKMQALSAEELRAKTDELRARVKDGTSLDAVLPEAFAAVREASVRTLGLRHFDVQLIGGMVLHEGRIAEMRTGEGKTLVATLAAYLNALTGKAVHVVTVNDYLAQRDAEWMGPIYSYLGLSVGVIVSGQDNATKRDAYAKDIVYGTNNEFGFDYLRDNMVFQKEDKVQRGLYFAIIDEVDSILIDEARTPLIISGASDDSSELYVQVDKLIPGLERQFKIEKMDDPVKPEEVGDYTLDEKNRQAYLTERGYQKIEDLCLKRGLVKPGESLYDIKNIRLMHHLNAALRAHTLYHRDVDYIVRNGEVIIVDEHTGRTMEGRRWSDGLHQAVEAKEQVKVQSENQTLASITFQNFFRLYDKLSGMTGTADTEAYEFQHIYGLEVVVIPTNRPMIREDLPDQVYLTAEAKFAAVLEDVKVRHANGQPILVGTASIETSERVSNLLRNAGIKHQVLNAKQHEREAKIIAQAGQPGAVTIATNMAGRGTDIVLGGSLEARLAELPQPASDEAVAEAKAAWKRLHDEVVAAGGLHVIGSERHESRRIDNQLRGRSGRQGDPGSSRFYLSLEDNLLRIFASERLAGLMRRLGMEEHEAIEHKMVTRAIENAQRKVEGHNFDIRKNLLEFDDVANEQRKVVYRQRDHLMELEDISGEIKELRKEAINLCINEFIPPGSLSEDWDVAGLEKMLAREFFIQMPLTKWLEADDELDETGLRAKILAELEAAYHAKEEQIGAPIMRNIECTVMLQVLDNQWKDHLAAMDHLRDGIHLRGYAQQNPKQEYKKEAFYMFVAMLERVKVQTLKMLYAMQIRTEEELQALERARRRRVEQERMKMHYIHTNQIPANELIGQQAANRGEISPEFNESSVVGESDGEVAMRPYTRRDPKIGRNDLCPCGSGKKYKHCHGKLE